MIGAPVTTARVDALREAMEIMPALQRGDRPARLLAPLLAALGWRGEAGELREALPYFADDFDLTDLRNALAALGYRTHESVDRLGDIDSRLGPTVFVDDENMPHLLIGDPAGGYLEWVDGEFQRVGDAALTAAGRAFVISKIDSADRAAGTGEWFDQLWRRFSASLATLTLTSFVSSLFAILVPVFVMVVYDRVIGRGAAGMLPMLVVGVAVILSGDIAARLVKARVLSRMAGRFDYIVGAESFKKLLRLPLTQSERAAVSTQISRLKEFETLRDFFTGPLASTMVEAPFSLLVLAVLAVIGGPLALIPVAAAAVLGVLAVVWRERGKELERRAGQARAEKQNLVVETVMHRENLAAARVEGEWSERFRHLSARDCALQQRLQRHGVMLEASASFVLNLSALTILAWGASRVLDGAMSVGALIACMALAWRLLAPVQTAALAAAKIARVRTTIAQLNAFFKLREEFRTVTRDLRRPGSTGAVRFDKVSLRYTAANAPALLGVSFDVEPGQLFGITGRSSAGKSSVLKVLLGLYPPQSGQVFLDGVDVRQIDVRTLRRSISYAPQETRLFHGTIRQNLLLSHPMASDADIFDALRATRLHDYIDSLPKGLDTRIGDQTTARVPRGFARRLTIARALVRPSDVLLLDEPEQSLDDDGEAMLVDLLLDLKGRKTVILVTHRPRYLRLADSVAIVADGAVKAVGPAEAVLEAAKNAVTGGEKT